MYGKLASVLALVGSAVAYTPVLRVMEEPTTFGVKYIAYTDGTCDLLHAGVTQMHRTALADGLVVEKREYEHLSTEDQHHHDHDGHDKSVPEGVDQLVEAFSPRLEDAMSVMDSSCEHITDLSSPVLTAEDMNDEVTEIVRTGERANRIDVVMMGDGYTASQRQRHLDDMRRLTDEMFTGDTFTQYLPVFNIWAVYRESAEEGVGINSRPRNTAFGLYRQGSQLRGLFTSRASAARQACRATGPSGCDFPSLIGNDDYYGGLGGEFTISTRSPTTGTIVLRHEMGHNFINVGEEYDGGQVYRGVNWASSPSNVGWRHWLTDQTTFPPRVEESDILVQDYAWYDLSRGRYTIDFTSTGNYDRWFLRFTTSGTETDDSLKIYLDGVELDWSSSGLLDRSFYSYYEETPWSQGRHKLEFEAGSNPAPGQPIRQLCSVTMHEYKSDDNGFIWDNNYIGLYKNWRVGGSAVGYRPTNELCLMRNMTSPSFCKPCQEGMWLQFFNRMSVIDSVNSTATGTDVNVDVNVVPLGQFREPGTEIPGERLTSYWTQNGVRRTEFDDLFSISAPTSSAAGNWEVHVDFETDIIRRDPRGLTHFTKTFTL